MKQVVLFDPKDVKEMKDKVKDSVCLIKGQPMLSHIDCMLLHNLSDILGLLNREEE